MEEDSPVPLQGIVEVDETRIGGVHQKTPAAPTGRTGTPITAKSITRRRVGLGISHTNTIESVWSLFKRSVVGTITRRLGCPCKRSAEEERS